MGMIDQKVNMFFELGKNDIQKLLDSFTNDEDQFIKFCLEMMGDTDEMTAELTILNVDYDTSEEREIIHSIDSPKD